MSYRLLHTVLPTEATAKPKLIINAKAKLNEYVVRVMSILSPSRRALIFDDAFAAFQRRRISDLKFSSRNSRENLWSHGQDESDQQSNENRENKAPNDEKQRAPGRTICKRFTRCSIPTTGLTCLTSSNSQFHLCQRIGQ